jgi:intraflagellar transport protein 140
MQDLRSRVRNVNIAYFVSMQTIENIHRVLDIPLGRGHGGHENEED